MKVVMEERPKYSTGFRVFVAGSIIAALGLLAATLGAKSIGLVLLLVGGFPAIWFKYPRDWRKTWPDDFPILARAFGCERRPERWARTTNWWDHAPARSRARRSIVEVVAGLALLGWGATKPGDYHEYPSHTGMLLIGAFVASAGFVQLRRALRDRRAQ